MTPRVCTGMPGLDILLGGGLSRSTYFIEAERGLGVTTLALQIAGGIARQDWRTLFVSGEMRAAEILDYGKRVGCPSTNFIEVACESDADAITERAKVARPDVLVVDSVNTVVVSDVPMDPGTPASIKAAINYLTSYAEHAKCGLLLLAHTIPDEWSHTLGARLCKHHLVLDRFKRRSPAGHLRVLTVEAGQSAGRSAILVMGSDGLRDDGLVVDCTART